MLHICKFNNKFDLYQATSVSSHLLSFFLPVSLLCGQRSSENCTYLTLGATTTTPSPADCTYTICKCSSNICRIRLDFMVSTHSGNQLPYFYYIYDNDLRLIIDIHFHPKLLYSSVMKALVLPFTLIKIA
jgi:hypothetical protein